MQCRDSAESREFFCVYSLLFIMQSSKSYYKLILCEVTESQSELEGELALRLGLGFERLWGLVEVAVEVVTSPAR